MQQFSIHTVESAPEESKPALQGVQQKFGFIPNVAATMAENPVLINAFVGGFTSFDGGSFSEVERQALLLTKGGYPPCDEKTIEPLKNLKKYPGAQHLHAVQKSYVPVLPITFVKGRKRLSYFSTASTIGTPHCITAQEFRVECMFPAENGKATQRGYLCNKSSLRCVAGSSGVASRTLFFVRQYLLGSLANRSLSTQLPPRV
jgi:hypothetical protein